MKNLASLKTSELVVEYNAISGKPAITKWKRKVVDLIAILLKARPDLFMYETAAPSDRMTDFEAPAEELAAQKGRPVDHVEAPAASKRKAQKKAKETATQRGAIRKLCEELLLKAKGTDEKSKRPLGLPYSEILAEVQKKHPEAETSINCLRWYATKLNKLTGKERVVMPVRPKTSAAA